MIVAALELNSDATKYNSNAAIRFFVSRDAECKDSKDGMVEKPRNPLSQKPRNREMRKEVNLEYFENRKTGKRMEKRSPHFLPLYVTLSMEQEPDCLSAGRSDIKSFRLL